MQKNSSQPEPIPDALRHFDDLPNSAHVRLPVVCALFACAPATVWRNVKKQKLPSPARIGAGVTAWNVGALRQVMLSSGEDA
ncbi:AlpA family transcriptional regulator [Methylococcus sp. EFPC2]|uniref:helix-turn-helix transcriptional regulator n=1 Tax=Methylococcus sp. EFPC2 TaxID=2812648 RepID=UPI001967B40A|nr:hypothetical protein [Methylococcus sp. EFPC2]QSA98721.1 hypothetical protein JWZ97_08040 [Methylococcus sp. EFPC2]